MSRLERGNLRFALTLGVIFAIALAAVGATYIARSIEGSPPSLASSDSSDEKAMGVLTFTPPMGWNGYNHFGLHVTAELIEAEARALIRSGMKEAGYTYVNLDGGWDLPFRGAEGELLPDPVKFPNGIKPVADYVHSLGLKFGIYASAGTENCAGTAAGSYGHYEQDAATWASWGVDYIKFDWCSIPYVSYPRLQDRQIAAILTQEMGQAIVASGRPMVYDVNYPFARAWSWVAPMAEIWRTSMDSKATYKSLISNFLRDVGYYPQARPGHWNDPDMLEVGNGPLTPAEQQAEFSLWSELAAPLIAGNDLVKMSAATRDILTNVAVIAVDQDALGLQGYPVSNTGGLWVLTRQLANGDRAVVLFNSTAKPKLITTTANQIGLGGAFDYALINLWTGVTTSTGGLIKAVVAPHGVVMYNVAIA